jgi:hypothetical protein
MSADITNVRGLLLLLLLLVLVLLSQCIFACRSATSLMKGRRTTEEYRQSCLLFSTVLFVYFVAEPQYG